MSMVDSRNCSGCELSHVLDGPRTLCRAADHHDDLSIDMSQCGSYNNCFCCCKELQLFYCKLSSEVRYAAIV